MDMNPQAIATRAADAAIARAAVSARQATRQAEVARLQAAHPELQSPTRERDSLVTAARNVRTELRARWPKIKFSVRTERFSGGDCLRISWTDGPSVALVDAIVDRYKSGSFNGMDDCYEYASRAWTDAFGDAKYINTNREYSPAAIAWAKAAFGTERDPRYHQEAFWEALGQASIVRIKTST